MASRSLAMVGCTLGSLVLLAGCTAGEAGLTGNAAGSASPSGSAGAGSGSPSVAPSASATEALDPAQRHHLAQAERPPDLRCESRERVLVRRGVYPMQLATDDLMQSLDGTSVLAARRIARRAHRARGLVLERCDRPSPEMRRYLRVASGQSEDALSHRDLRAVMAAYLAWATAVGEQMMARDLRRSQQGCRELKRKVHASHRVWWRWTDKGRSWWIELRFRSRLTQTVETSLHGRVRVTGLVDPDVSTPNGGRRSGVLGWGGSSLDSFPIRPGKSRYQVLGLGPVDTQPHGVFEVESVEVSVYAPGLPWWCSLPVPERS